MDGEVNNPTARIVGDVKQDAGDGQTHRIEYNRRREAGDRQTDAGDRQMQETDRRRR